MTVLTVPPARARERGLDLLSYIDASPTPYHAVAETVQRLTSAGFHPLDEREAWKLAPGDRRYLTRNGSSIIAFEVGSEAPAIGGVRIVAAHTDSPNLRLKPKAVYSKHGYRQVGVEVYGGVLYSTWLDRDLSVAGRLIVRSPQGTRAVLVDLAAPVLRIPNLAIHLNREVNTDGLKLNAQTHLPPIWALEGTPETELFRRLAEKAGVVPGDVVDHDLCLYDLQKGTLSGIDEPFLHTARLDNLGSCYSSVSALLDALPRGPAAHTRLVALFDHEEVGSSSAQGADGPFLKALLERLIEAHPQQAAQAFPRMIASSFCVSADMAHAVHPNYADRHEPHHQPQLGGGPVIKSNSNQRYATDAESAARFASFCAEAGVTPQHFVTRTDLGCGSTIGPITASSLGIKTVDVGNPMLSMHSCRELAGVKDLELMHAALVQAFA